MSYCTPVDTHSRQLQRVVPVARRADVGRFAVTVYSLEPCGEGFIVVTRTGYAGAGNPLPRPAAWSARDDRGNAYVCVNSGGSGGGTPETHASWRMDYVFTPALDPAARDLRLTLEEARDWLGGMTSSGDRAPQSISGPWMIVARL